MQWEVYAGEGSSGKGRWIAGIEQDDEGPFTLISLDLLLFEHLTEFLCSQGVFDLLKSCKMTTQDSPPYTHWCPFVGGAPSAFSKPPQGGEPLVPVEDCPCPAALPPAQNILWRDFGYWFEEFGFDFKV